MKLFLITLVALFVSGVAAVGVSEYWEAKRADDAMQDGEPARAFQLYTSLSGRKLWFLDRGDLAIRREAAAAGGLAAALRNHDFDVAADLIGVILTGPETGYETEAKPALSDLPQQHLEYLGTLVEDGRFEQALAESTQALPLYAGQPRVLEELGVLRSHAQLGLASTSLTAGDAARAIAILADLDKTAPTPEQFQAVKLVSTGMSHGSDGFVSSRDFPGLLIWFQSARDKLDGHPNLRRAAMNVAGDYAGRVFELPSSEVPDTLEIENPPMAEPVAPAAGSEYAVLTVSNRTSLPITVFLRGERDYRTAKPIEPGRTDRIVLPAGRYAEAVHASVPDPVPYLGVLRLAAVEYSQAFDVRDLHFRGTQTAASR